ncbi:MAG: ABC transporter permease [Flavobacteriales bacterium]|nr:ABC transporter permease [Flavobacteriales bacterium]
MFSIERWQEIFQAIAKNKLRTTLTGISVASGIFILVILLGLARSLENGIREQMAGTASTQIWINPGMTSVEYKGLNPGRVIQLRQRDFDYLADKFKDKFELQSPVIEMRNRTFVYGNESRTRYDLKGGGVGIMGIEACSIIEGRSLNQNDIVNATKNIIIGKAIQTDMFRDKSPIGEYLYINSIPFRVVGVFENASQSWKEHSAYAAIGTVSRIFNKADKIDNIAFTMRVPDNPSRLEAESDQLLDGVRTALRQLHTVAPNDERAFYVFSSVERSKSTTLTLFAINTFFWWIGICTIVAGVVGVSNIMMIVVKERTKEIGIRKALGARPIAIIGMILQESVFITTLSGFIGLISSLGLLELISQFELHPMLKKFEVDFQIATTTLVLLIITGVIAGFIPARKAALVKPIEALKDE